MCGEKMERIGEFTVDGGSPPRVRGKVQRNACRLFGDGITPACAGKRFYAANNTAMAGDHPRVCGEKLAYHGDVISAVGSPPRVRGKVAYRYAVGVVHRITPACAGKR